MGASPLSYTQNYGIVSHVYDCHKERTAMRAKNIKDKKTQLTPTAVPFSYKDYFNGAYPLLLEGSRDDLLSLRELGTTYTDIPFGTHLLSFQDNGTTFNGVLDPVNDSSRRIVFDEVKAKSEGQNTFEEALTFYSERMSTDHGRVKTLTVPTLNKLYTAFRDLLDNPIMEDMGTWNFYYGEILFRFGRSFHDAKTPNRKPYSMVLWGIQILNGTGDRGAGWHSKRDEFNPPILGSYGKDEILDVWQEHLLKNGFQLSTEEV